MEAFVRVVETGSFSNAAHQLRIGQPAISKTIAQLETRLNVRLLLRSRNVRRTSSDHDTVHYAQYGGGSTWALSKRQDGEDGHPERDVQRDGGRRRARGRFREPGSLRRDRVDVSAGPRQRQGAAGIVRLGATGGRSMGSFPDPAIDQARRPGHSPHSSREPVSRDRLRGLISFPAGSGRRHEASPPLTAGAVFKRAGARYSPPKREALHGHEHPDHDARRRARPRRRPWSRIASTMPSWCPAKATSTCSTGLYDVGDRLRTVTCRFEAGAVDHGGRPMAS